MIQTLVDLDELGHDAGFWYLASPYSGYTPRVHMAARHDPDPG